MSKLIPKNILKPAFLITMLLSPVLADANAILVKSKPGKNETVTEPPKRIELWFNEIVRSEYMALAVIDSKGKRVDNRDAGKNPADGTHIYATVADLPSGVYTVRYRVVSQDTLAVTGKFVFTIKP